MVRDYPLIHEENLKDETHYLSLLKRLHNEKKSIPLFAKDPSGELHIIGLQSNFTSINKHWKIVYLGKKLSEN